MNKTAISLGVQIMSAVGLLTSQAGGIINYAGSIPPKPDQSSIKCHDASWQKTNLVNFNGFELNEKFSLFISRMFEDGKKSGIYFRVNSAYRDCAEQGGLRAAACGLGEYNLYQKPINLCFPPTEPAGKSLHNEGLAVDLACNGYGFFESSPCYGWLKTNSTRYHLTEHELEPWHWSTTGK